MGNHGFKPSARGFYYAPQTPEAIEYVYKLTGQEVPAAETVDVAAVDEVTVTYKDEKHGVELRFPGKPSEIVRGQLKDAGFRWHRVEKCWYAKQSNIKAMAFADAFVQEDVELGEASNVEGEPVIDDVLEAIETQVVEVKALPPAPEPKQCHLSIVPDPEPTAAWEVVETVELGEVVEYSSFDETDKAEVTTTSIQIATELRNWMIESKFNPMGTDASIDDVLQQFLEHRQATKTILPEVV